MHSVKDVRSPLTMPNIIPVVIKFYLSGIVIISGVGGGRTDNQYRCSCFFFFLPSKHFPSTVIWVIWIHRCKTLTWNADGVLPCRLSFPSPLSQAYTKGLDTVSLPPGARGIPGAGLFAAEHNHRGDHGSVCRNPQRLALVITEHCRAHCMLLPLGPVTEQL